MPLRPKERAVLAALARHQGAAISTAQIAEDVWGEHPPATAKKSVHNHVARLRRVAPGLIETIDGRYQFSVDVDVDLETRAGSDSVPFADLTDSIAIIGARNRVQELLAVEEEHRLADEATRGATPALLDRLHQAVDDEPFRERRWYLFAAQQAELGLRREALLTLQRARSELGQVGLEPGHELAELERRILLGSTDASSPDPADAATVQQIIHLHRGDPFVGRQVELERLDRLFDVVTTERRVHAAIIHGPAGMGKTRLVDRFTESLQATGRLHRLLWGRYREVSSRPHEMLGDTLTRLLDDEPSLLDSLDSAVGALRAIVPRPLVGGVNLPIMGEAMLQAHIAHGVSEVIRHIATAPTIWFIDDAQWATDEAIDVIEQTIVSFGGPLLLIVGTRPMADGGHRGVAMLDRLVPTVTFDLEPFTVSESADLLTIAARDTSPTTTHQVHDRTGGLPLYTSEIARHARLTGAPISTSAIPGTIRDWVGNRVHGLDPAVVEVLNIASVIGDSADIRMLRIATRAAMSNGPAAHAAGDAAIDALVSLGLLTFGSDPSTAHFSHALTRDLVYERIGVASRQHLHGIVADALTDLAETTGSTHHAALAHHLSFAGPSARARAAFHSEQAGDAELVVGAWSAAIAHFRAAADGAANSSDRARTLIGCGRALLGAGQFDAAAEALRDAVEIARAEGDAVTQAAATIALVGRAGRGAAIHASDDTQIAMIRSALRNIERIDRSGHRRATILHSELERELAYALLLRDADCERSELLHAAVARVERLDPVPVRALGAAVLGSRYAKLGGAGLEERLSDIDRVLSWPAAELGPENLLAVRCYQHEELTRSGDLDAAVDALDHAAATARNYPDPYWTWAIATWRGVVDVVLGNLDAAEERALAAHAQRQTVDGAAACLGVNLVNIRLYQGRSGEVIELLQNAVDQHPEIPAYRAVLALCASEAGDVALAGRELEWFTAARFGNLPRDTSHLLASAVLAHTAADIGDTEAADLLLPNLEPASGQWVVLSCYGGGGATWGPVDHAIGRLLMLRQDHAGAAEYLDRARRLAGRSPLVSARVQRNVADLEAGSVPR